MKRKAIFNTILLVVTAILSISLMCVATYSWYRDLDERTQEFVIKAGGFLYIYLPATVEPTGQNLEPAIAMPNAVLNGKYMNPLVVFDEFDENPSYVSRVASVAQHSTDFTFYNEYSQFVQAKDEFGNLLYDEFGEPIYEQEVDEEGIPMVDSEDNPIYLREPRPASISYSLALKDTGNEENGKYIDIDEITIKEIYFSYSEFPIAEGLPINEENGAIDFSEISPSKTTGTLRVKGTKKIYIHIQIHLTNVDELMDSYLRERKIYLEIELSVVLDGLLPGEE